MPDSAAFQKGSDEIYRCLELEALPWLAHGFTNRHSASRLTGVVTLRQVHSARVVRGDGLEDRACEGDALIARNAGVIVGVRTADCVPILLAHAKLHAVAAIHAGWRGTAAGIARHAVEAMSREFGSDPAHIHAAFGPAIRRCCYEVGPEVAQQFQVLFPEGLEASAHAGRFMLDLIEANRRVLSSAGVEDGQVYDSELCTFCQGEFYSYRREPEEGGRTVSFAGCRG